MTVTVSELVASRTADEARRAQLDEENRARIEEIEVSRLYYDGLQYEGANADALAALDCKRLPEHEKLVAYSTQIQECVDYVAAQLSSGFQVSSDNQQVDEVITATLSNSPDLASDDDEADINVMTQFRDAAIAGDVAVRVRWDTEKGMPWLEFWESEAVDFHFQQDNRFVLERVVLSEVVWVGSGAEQVEVSRRREWFMASGICYVATFEDDEPVGIPESTGWSFIPWRMWRASRKNVRQPRGQSLITKRIRDLADRYDAIEQLAFAIARYNSHGNLVVVGDAALLQANQDARIRKDVADVLTFPGGTSAYPIELPTDPEMIEHQRNVCLDALFSAFGVARLDADTVQGLGTLSGYALEILNRKTDGTFEQVKRQLARDIRSTLNLALDVYALMMSAGDGEEDAVDPDEVFEDRTMTIVMGSGYIVDEVMLRDDFTAGLVSRRYALRKRGLTDPEIDEIDEQIAKEKPAATTVDLSAVARAASQVQAGSTLGNAVADVAALDG